MGRYSTVQVFSDNNPGMRSISYDQATGQASSADEEKKSAATEVSAAATGTKAGPVVTEKVVNPYASTAGAGSGEFHVYRHARAREMARMQAIEEEDKEKKAELEFQQKVESLRKDDEERTEKRKKKRQREKEAKRRKKAMKDNGLIAVSNGNLDSGFSVEDMDEFQYTPMPNPSKTSTDISFSDPIPNDGSFLEMMKKKMEEEKLPR